VAGCGSCVNEASVSSSFWRVMRRMRSGWLRVAGTYSNNDVKRPLRLNSLSSRSPGRLAGLSLCRYKYRHYTIDSLNSVDVVN
jgi:hypothetical protein